MVVGHGTVTGTNNVIKIDPQSSIETARVNGFNKAGGAPINLDG